MGIATLIGSRMIDLTLAMRADHTGARPTEPSDATLANLRALRRAVRALPALPSAAVIRWTVR